MFYGQPLVFKGPVINYGQGEELSNGTEGCKSTLSFIHSKKGGGKSFSRVEGGGGQNVLR